MTVAVNFFVDPLIERWTRSDPAFATIGRMALCTQSNQTWDLAEPWPREDR